ncbi:c-type cytochrome [soil metagenome]
MKKIFLSSLSKNRKILLASALAPALLLAGFKEGIIDRGIKQLDPKQAVEMARAIEAEVKPELEEGLSMKVWGVDSLVADPVSIHVDNLGRLFYSRTNRQKSSEFDIRGHQDWEIESIKLQTIEEKRAFLRRVLAPENSHKNQWLKDLNGDGSHDWRDLTVQKEQVFRLEDTSGDGVADRSLMVVEDFHEEVTDVAGAIMTHENEIFVGAGPDMWRLIDTNGDGVADEKTSISHGYGIHIGFGGHGMSGLEMGPDGKVYWGIGDIGFNGVDKAGNKHEYPNSGVIVRSNPDGSDFEVFAHGVRNTHEFVFDEYGNLISQDNDGDHPGERERLVYIVNGSDTGWRINWQFGKYRDPDNNGYKVWMDEDMYKPRFEGQAAYITPTLANFVSGPTGLVYNPGTALSPKYQNTFFVAEFVGSPARSGIHTFKLNPKGASFELGEHKKIMSGVLATGLDFGPDGALYVADWINGWNTKNYGRIWRMDEADQTFKAERERTKTLLAEDFSQRQDNDLGELLKNQDMRVRRKAQFELAKRGDKGANVFRKSIKQRSHQLARVHGIIGMSQLARQDQKYAKALLPLLKDRDPEIRAQAAKWLGDVRHKEAGKALMPLLKDQNSRARFFAAEALGRIAYEPAVAPIIEMLQANNDEDVYLRHAGSLALARIGKAEPVAALFSHSSRALRIAAVVALRRMQHPGIASFLADQDEFVVTEAARAINDDLSIKEALPALGNLLVNTRFTNEALIRRSINANLRVGTDQAMQNLIDYSRKEGSPVAMRTEAMAALSTWAKPSVLDRVDGRYRGEINRDPTGVTSKAADPLIQLLSHQEPAIRIGAVQAISKLQIAQASPNLMARLKEDQMPEVRVEALRAMGSMNDKQLGKAIEQALSDQEKSVRIAGLDILGRSDISQDLMVPLLSDVINTRTPEEKQAALVTLGKLPVKNTQKVFDQLLKQMAAGKLAPEIHLELAEAIDSTGSAQLKAQHKTITAKFGPDALAASDAGSLDGGNPDQGRRLFFRHQTAQCIRCHSYDDLGGNAGPRLNGIASKLSRKELLEALSDPSARIAPGFGNVTVALKNGTTASGTIVAEDKAELTVRTGGQADQIVRKDQIARRTNAPSSMPNMQYLLTQREVRDLVSFLSTLETDD